MCSGDLRRACATLAALLVTLPGLACVREVEVSWRIDASAASASAVNIELAVTRGSCALEGPSAYAAVIPHARGVTRALPRLAAGDYCFRARTLDVECRPTAEGQTDASLPTDGGNVTTRLDPRAFGTSVCSASEACSAGTCVPAADAGADDAATPDAAGLDSGGSDGGDGR